MNIAQHLRPKYDLAGIVYLDALPYVDAILPAIASPAVISVLPSLVSNDIAPQTYLDAKTAFVAGCFATQVPYRLHALWLGISMSCGPDTARRIFSRPQDPTRLFEWAQEGLPLLLLHGRDDATVLCDKLVQEITPKWKRMTVDVMDGLGGMRCTRRIRSVS